MYLRVLRFRSFVHHVHFFGRYAVFKWKSSWVMYLLSLGKRQIQWLWFQILFSSYRGIMLREQCLNIIHVLPKQMLYNLWFWNYTQFKLNVFFGKVRGNKSTKQICFDQSIVRLYCTQKFVSDRCCYRGILKNVGTLYILYTDHRELVTMRRNESWDLNFDKQIRSR